MDKWQPIATAPTDGTKIDLWVVWEDGDGHRVPDSYWSDEGFMHDPSCRKGPGWAAENKGYDGTDGYADDPGDGLMATHWMPRPTPPTPSERES